MDVTPLIPAGRQVIEAYGASGFRVTGTAHAGSILVFPDATIAWPVAAMAELSIELLAPVVERGDVEILLLGCGRRMAPVPGAPLMRAQHRFVELARERAKLSDPLARGGRFHILTVPQGTPEEGRRGKSAKKKLQ